LSNSLLKCRWPLLEQEAHLWRIGRMASQATATSSLLAQCRTRCLKACLLACSVMDAIAVTHTDNQHDQAIILQLADDAVIAHPITPEPCKWTGESFAFQARVGCISEQLPEIGNHTFGCGKIQFA
jgi:hypothetical protein